MEQHAQHCLVCGEPIEYRDTAVSAACHYCGDRGQTLIVCPAGHFVCDTCHGAGTLDPLLQLAERVSGESPEELLEAFFALPDLPMHGPEHHSLAALALLSAAKKQGAMLPYNAFAEAIRRSLQIPGGACGYLGSCGAGISLGIAVSLLTGATPVKGVERSLANRASALGLVAAGDGEARCCKRALCNALREGRRFLAVELGIVLPDKTVKVRCRDMARNRECAGKNCPYFL